MHTQMVKLLDSNCTIVATAQVIQHLRCLVPKRLKVCFLDKHFLQLISRIFMNKSIRENSRNSLQDLVLA